MSAISGEINHSPSNREPPSVKRHIHVKDVLQKDTAVFGIKLASAARYSQVCIDEAILQKFGKHSLRYLKGTGFLNGYFALQAIKPRITHFSKETRSDKVDSAITIISKAGVFGESVEASYSFLNEVGLITNAAKWSRPLLVVCLGCEIIGSALAVKGLVTAHQISGSLEKQVKSDKNELSLEDYRKSIKVILDKRDASQDFIKEFIHQDEALIAHRLMVIEANAAQKLKSSNPDEVAQARKSLKGTAEALKTRMEQNKNINRISLVAAAVSIAGSFVLFLTSLVALPFGMFAGAGLLSLGNTYGYKKRIEDQFKKTIFSNY